MLYNGQYTAWFRIPNEVVAKEGMGIVTLADGKISGRDTVIAYRGFYSQEGDDFTATIATTRHSEGMPAIFGIDEVEIEMVGRSRVNTASCKGRARQFPEVPFEVVLVRMSE